MDGAGHPISPTYLLAATFVLPLGKKEERKDPLILRVTHLHPQDVLSHVALSTTRDYPTL